MRRLRATTSRMLADRRSQSSNHTHRSHRNTMYDVMKHDCDMTVTYDRSHDRSHRKYLSVRARSMMPSIELPRAYYFVLSTSIRSEHVHFTGPRPEPVCTCEGCDILPVGSRCGCAFCHRRPCTKRSHHRTETLQYKPSAIRISPVTIGHLVHHGNPNRLLHRNSCIQAIHATSCQHARSPAG